MDSAIDDIEVEVVLEISQPSITRYCMHLENDACRTQARLKTHNRTLCITPLRGVFYMITVEKIAISIS